MISYYTKFKIQEFVWMILEQKLNRKEPIKCYYRGKSFVKCSSTFTDSTYAADHPHFVPDISCRTISCRPISCPSHFVPEWPISCPSHFVPILFRALVFHFRPVPFRARPTSFLTVPFRAGVHFMPVPLHARPISCLSHFMPVPFRACPLIWLDIEPYLPNLT